MRKESTRKKSRTSATPVVALVSWYRKAQRAMPWRARPAPYVCWLSEIMMQQTTYAQALPYFERFLARFPTVEALAQANEADVLKAWEGLGYYARARNLHKAAARIVAEGWPQNAATWMNLPGIGPYTAAALSSVLSGERKAVVDGNVARVAARYWLLEDDFKDMRNRQKLATRLEELMTDVPPGEFNQAMMELGALVCTPREPLCGECPLRATCCARAKQVQADYPKRTKRRPLPLREATACVVPDGTGRILLVKRPTAGLLGGLWELPHLSPEHPYTQTFTHFKLALSVLRLAEGKPEFVNPAAVPLTVATRKVLASCGLL